MSPWAITSFTAPFMFQLYDLDKRHDRQVSHEIQNASSQNTQHTALAEATQPAVNNFLSYFNAWEGNKAFQPPLKECFRNSCLGPVGRDKREVPRNLQGIKHRTNGKLCQICSRPMVPWHGVQIMGVLRTATESLPETPRLHLAATRECFCHKQGGQNLEWFRSAYKYFLW